MNVTRRTFLAAASSAALLRAKHPTMPLALSVSVVEGPGKGRGNNSMSFELFVKLAQRLGYQGICMRASQAGIQTPKDRQKEMGQLAAAANLKVTNTCGDFDIVDNNVIGPNCLRAITPHLDLAENFHTDLIRICMQQPDDIAWAQKACDEAKERKIRLMHMSHRNSLFKTVDLAIDTLKKINRPNFVLTYEPANWQEYGQDIGPETIKRIQPWLAHAFIGNSRATSATPGGAGNAPAPGSPEALAARQTKGGGPPRARPANADDGGGGGGGRELGGKLGLPLASIFEGFYAIGYSGFVDYIGGSTGDPDKDSESAAAAYRILKPLVSEG